MLLASHRKSRKYMRIWDSRISLKACLPSLLFERANKLKPQLPQVEATTEHEEDHVPAHAHLYDSGDASSGICCSSRKRNQRANDSCAQRTLQ
jgi:hypothetical protein